LFPAVPADAADRSCHRTIPENPRTPSDHVRRPIRSAGHGPQTV